MPPRTEVDAIAHADKRVNIPTADAQDFVRDDDAAPKVLGVERNTALDPQLVWRGKDAQDEQLTVQAPPVYIQEKIDPRALVEDLRRSASRTADELEATLFDDFDGLEGYESIDYYRHEANWSNRMILGDSLEVMASLAEREDLRGQVQCIYLDPPYGIGFASNWQTSTEKRDVKDRLPDVTRQVEQIKAFRDAWEDGIHSYLIYLRDRLQVAHGLLTEAGSVFVQIGDENVHLVRALLDEVFGRENFISQIVFTKTTGMSAGLLPNTSDHLLWYARSKKEVKFRGLFQHASLGSEGATEYTRLELPDESVRRVTFDELIGRVPLPAGARAFTTGDVTSDGGVAQEVVLPDGRRLQGKSGVHWKTTVDGLRKLWAAGRLMPTGRFRIYKRYYKDFPYTGYSNVWSDTRGESDKTYVVQTSRTVVERCLLMTTDPGDLVLDPTCGSGTTAYVAEQWGRRWITIDTSRVALALARQRLMGAKFPYYLLADSPEGQVKEAALTGTAPSQEPTTRDVRRGFVYTRVPHVTLKSIANNPEIREGMTRDEIDAAIAGHADVEVLYDRPYDDPKRVRVAGRFTVESLSPHRSLSFDSAADPDAETVGGGSVEEEPAPSEAPGYERTILDNLLKAGVQNGRKAERLVFEELEPYPGQLLQAIGMRRDADADTPQRVAVAIGPEYGTVSQQFVKAAAREALRGSGCDLLLVLGFAFDAQALETVEEFRPSDPSDFATVVAERPLGRLPVLLVRMNADLAMGDELLKKTGAGNLFTVFGEPDVAVETTEDGLVVEIRGVDVYNPTTGEVRSDSPDSVALWMIDTDYDGEQFLVRHAYFSGATDPYGKLKRALKADIDEAAWQSLYGTRSRPFPKPSSGRIAVKAINDYGDEVLSVIDVP